MPTPRADHRLIRWLPLLPAVWLAACAAGGAPPRLLRLPIDPPAAAPPRAMEAPAWQLAEPVQLPAYLDRETVVLPSGSTGLRWAEPLRDALPRLLRSDLAAWRGVRTWGAPLPAGLVVARRLRVEVLAFDVLPGARAVRLRAQWTLEDPRAALPPQAGAADFNVDVAGDGAAALQQAHRAALWRLAGEIAATPP